MPPLMREIVGMRYAEVGPAAAEEWTTEGYAPEVDVGEAYEYGPPDISVPVAPEEVGPEIDPALLRFVQALEDFITRPDVARYLGDDFVGDLGPELRVRGLGQGFAVYAPAFLYESWDSSVPGFNDFHERVLSHESELEVVQPVGVWPGVGAAIYRDWSVGLASPDGAAASVLVYGGGNQVYAVPAGAMRLGNPAEENRVELLFPGAAVAVARPVPIYVWPQDEGAVATVSVLRYDTTGIELRVHGTGARTLVRGDAVSLWGGQSTTMEIEIRDGAYRVPRGSTHRVVVREGSAGRLASDKELMPNPDTGSLVIPGAFVSATITVEPVGY
jgi:hypothetical protein